jgi:hypothetical protein
VENYGRTGQATDGTIIWRVGIVRWINKATGTHSDYVIFTGLPPQQMLREIVSILHLTYIVSLVQIGLITVALTAGTFMYLPYLCTTGRLGRIRR